MDRTHLRFFVNFFFKWDEQCKNRVRGEISSKRVLNNCANSSKVRGGLKGRRETLRSMTKGISDDENTSSVYRYN